ncbi:YiaA/YiaB family inner membrane protein [Nocardiopsis coralliicola]
MSSSPFTTKVTAAFYLQAMIAFGVSSAGLLAGIAFLPIDHWMRAFIAMGVLFVITSTFTLAKCVRDRQEEVALESWTDQAYAAANQRAYSGK